MPHGPGAGVPPACERRTRRPRAGSSLDSGDRRTRRAVRAAGPCHRRGVAGVRSSTVAEGCRDPFGNGPAPQNRVAGAPRAARAARQAWSFPSTRLLNHQSTLDGPSLDLRRLRLDLRFESSVPDVDQFPWVRCALSGGIPWRLWWRVRASGANRVATHPLLPVRVNLRGRAHALTSRGICLREGSGLAAASPGPSSLPGVSGSRGRSGRRRSAGRQR